jgi:mono/diheme cytochrome c family protein
MTNAPKAFAAALCVAIPVAAQSIANAAPAADDALVQRGAYLAKVGDCVACHSAQGGKAFGGGLPMKTQVGEI